MIDEAAIDYARDNRLENNKLKARDISKLNSVLQKMFAGLVSKYKYKFIEKLTALDDSIGDEDNAAQVAACIIEMESLGFPVGELTGTRTGVKGSEFTEFGNYVLEVFTKLGYEIPIEFSTFQMSRAYLGRRTSGPTSIPTQRVF